MPDRVPGGVGRGPSGQPKWGGFPVMNVKADLAALARLISYSEQEALRLGLSGVVIECLRMANIELSNLTGTRLTDEDAKVASVN